MFQTLAEAAKNCTRNISGGIGPVLSTESQRQAASVLVRENRVSELIEALKDGDTSRRVTAICSLAELGANAKEAVPAMIDVLEDGDWVVRIAAITALGDIGEAAAEAVPALIDSLEREDVCVSAAIALGRIGPAAGDAIEPLCKLKSRKTGFDCWCAEEAVRLIRQN